MNRPLVDARYPEYLAERARGKVTGHRWQDVKAEAYRRHPQMADPERKAAARAALDAFVAGYHLAELRKSLGLTQTEVAAVLGVTQARISQIERGRVEVDGVGDVAVVCRGARR
ncbi:helix-turn-helix domain-containing protein [Streptomycetaceae bacterium NBC_01309]